MVHTIKCITRMILALSFFGSVNLFAQCDLELQEKISRKIKEDNVEFLKDFSVKLGNGEKFEKYSMVLKEANWYRFYIFESEKYDGKGHFEFRKDSILQGSNLHKNSGRIFPYFDFKCKKTSVYSFTVFKDEGEKYCAELVLAYVGKHGKSDESKSTTPTTEVCTVVEVMPEFIKGQPAGSAFRDWMIEQIKYPEQAKKDEISGRVFVQFVVSGEGIVKNVKVVRGVHPILDEYAVELIEDSPKWYKPGYNKGEAVNTQFTFPVVFKL